MKRTLVIRNLTPDHAAQREDATLTRAHMQRIVGGRMAQQGPNPNIPPDNGKQEWEYNIAHFEGRIGGAWLV